MEDVEEPLRSATGSGGKKAVSRSARDADDKEGEEEEEDDEVGDGEAELASARPAVLSLSASEEDTEEAVEEKEDDGAAAESREWKGEEGEMEMPSAWEGGCALSFSSPLSTPASSLMDEVVG